MEGEDVMVSIKHTRDEADTQLSKPITYAEWKNISSRTVDMVEGFREAGIVEKLLPSYGFIQCCERQARLFFHYSQFKGNIDHLKLGDPVEFEMTYDRRTGKPIASMVVKISSEAFLGEELSSERVSGFITTELGEGREGRVAYEHRGECFFLPFTTKDLEDTLQVVKQNDRVTFLITPDKSGNLRARKIALETPTPERYQGVVCTLKDSFGFIERADVVKEIFFHSSECKDFKSLSLGDDVEFRVQTRNNKEVAVSVDRLPPGTVVFEDISPEIITGRVSKLIDRHNNHSFSRQHFTSNSLQSGSSSSEPFPGKIVYMDGNTEKEISFGDKDVRGDFTLQVGDMIQFNVVTDRRDKLEHATNIAILDETFENSEEIREQGYIAALKDSYGFVKCLNREGTRIFFRFAELLEPSIIPKLNEEVGFTIAPDHSMPGRLQAIRIKFLPDGTIFKNLYAKPNFGTENSSDGRLPAGFGSNLESRLRNGYGNNNMDPMSESNGNCEFPLIDLNTDESTTTGKSSLSSGDYLSKSAEPQFGKTQNSWSHILSQLPITMNSDPTIENNPNTNSNTNKDTNENSQLIDIFSSVDETPCAPLIKPLEPALLKNALSNENNCNDNDPTKFAKLIGDNQNDTDSNKNAANCTYTGKNGMKAVQRGFVAALKDSFGFIENENHKNEVFFHYSVYDGNIQSLELGNEVEYTLSVKNSKLNAEYVKKLPSGSIPGEESEPEMLNGTVIRSVRCLNPDQDEYWGLVQVIDSPHEEGHYKPDNVVYEFSMTSLADIYDYVQKGDLVTFQLSSANESGHKRALNIKPVRSKVQATVDAIKGNFGFLNYEVEEGKKLFFHMSEVRGENTILSAGDTVEFAIVQNQRNGKYSACSVVKQSDAINTPRPERLITRLKSMVVDENVGPKMVLLRQPKGPDGSKGFSVVRQPGSSTTTVTNN
ncbi:cold shock domain-containing protein E1 isoform X1 [Tetranychus urticae]|uniref:cold shock domain-containing protein E1 isoform X1 n=1 Tax=Tetranychus urticae TaxID=32264 RepID=UPI00077BF22F|nr:cold shock domain-containing protein E1 isoform X1 [Tetranychus urticae]